MFVVFLILAISLLSVPVITLTGYYLSIYLTKKNPPTIKQFIRQIVTEIKYARR